MEQVPIYLKLFFILITSVAVWQLYICTIRSKSILWLVLLWLLIQAVVALSGFYTNTSGVPPRFALCIIPPLLFIAALFLTRKGRFFIDSLSLGNLTLIHIIRIPVEIGLFGLFVHKAIPELMTFEGINFDVLSGLSAIVVYYFALIRKSLSRNFLLAWNFICLGLLTNIVGHAIAAAPFQFQSIAFDQPNRAIFYFPFVWLPAFIVPLVLFAHLVAIRKLLCSSRGSYAEMEAGTIR